MPDVLLEQYLEKETRQGLKIHDLAPRFMFLPSIMTPSFQDRHNHPPVVISTGYLSLAVLVLVRGSFACGLFGSQYPIK